MTCSWLTYACAGSRWLMPLCSRSWTVPPCLAPLTATAGPLESAAVPTVISWTLAWTAVGLAPDELLPPEGPPPPPLLHALRASAPTDSTAAAYCALRLFIDSCLSSNWPCRPRVRQDDLDTHELNG